MRGQPVVVGQALHVSILLCQTIKYDSLIIGVAAGGLHATPVATQVTRRPSALSEGPRARVKVSHNFHDQTDQR